MDDAELVRRFARGDRAAFVDLVSRYESLIYGLACQMLGVGPDAEDVAQETFARAYEHAGGITEGGRFRSWLVSVAANLCRDRLRWRARHRHVSMEGEVDLDRELPDRLPAADPITSWRVRRAVEGLAPDKRLVVVLREYHGMSYEDIAAAVGCPIGTVRWRLSEARRQLRASLKDLLE